jgi:hypothetical protein
VPSTTAAFPYAVWGSNAGDVYAVCGTGAGATGGEILHSSGGSWSEQISGTSLNLYGVWGSGAGDVYAVGMEGTILHSP